MDDNFVKKDFRLIFNARPSHARDSATLIFDCQCPQLHHHHRRRHHQWASFVQLSLEYAFAASETTRNGQKMTDLRAVVLLQLSAHPGH
jgi:hypothetical protein